MAINKNHEFEEINGIKCAIVEKNASGERVRFLKDLLEFNGFTVVVAPSPAAKPAAPPKPPAATEQAVEQAPEEVLPPAPETFTVGVTHLAFNPTNAIFGRLLRTPEGKVVTQAYWLQREAESLDDRPYYEN
jgi:hypothetical protein